METVIRRVHYQKNQSTRLVAIPCEMAEKLGINQGDEVEVRLTGSFITISKREEVKELLCL